MEEEEGGGGVIFIYTSFLRQGNIEALLCNDIFSMNRTSFFFFSDCEYLVEGVEICFASHPAHRRS